MESKQTAEEIVSARQKLHDEEMRTITEEMRINAQVNIVVCVTLYRTVVRETLKRLKDQGYPGASMESGLPGHGDSLAVWNISESTYSVNYWSRRNRSKKIQSSHNWREPVYVFASDGVIYSKGSSEPGERWRIYMTAEKIEKDMNDLLNSRGSSAVFSPLYRYVEILGRCDLLCQSRKLTLWGRITGK